MTPMMEQYLRIKAQHEDAILFYRLGDFYEMFFDDAKLVSRELELVLTGKDCGMDERAPMCGIPYHSSESYIGRLVAKGYKVVICEQTEDPATAKGLVNRDVVRIVTPGTIIETGLLDDSRNNYLCTVCVNGSRAGLCFADVSTSEVRGTFLSGEDLGQMIINELAAYSPRELLLSCPEAEVPEVAEYARNRQHTMVDDSRGAFFDRSAAQTLVLDRFGKTAADMGAVEEECAVAFGAMVAYIEETCRHEIPDIRKLTFYTEEQ